MGEGTFGRVMKALHIPSRTLVAIKLLKYSNQNNLQLKKIVSEIEILRKLSSIESNCFTTLILDLILPTDEQIETFNADLCDINGANSSDEASMKYFLFIV